jgi:hypothetical protein
MLPMEESPRYRIEHRRGAWLPARVMGVTATLAAAIVQTATLRRWLRAAGEGGRLVVVDQGGNAATDVAALRVAQDP